MSKIYIVERQDCDDTFIEGAFSTFEKAEKFCITEFNDLYNNRSQNYYVVISEITVDEKEVE